MNNSITESFSGKSQHLPFRPMLAARPSLLKTGRKERKPSFITEYPGQKSYTLVFEDDVLPSDVSGIQWVRVSSVEDVLNYQILLGDFCELYLSADYSKAHPEISGKLHLTAVRRKGTVSHPDKETTRRLLTRLPLNLKSLLQSPLAVLDGDHFPQPINRKFVHKKNIRNALISEPLIEGKFLSFNMFDAIDEFRFDHESDHFQGMLILEAMRQASIAAAHILGQLPLDGGMTLLSYDTTFYNYIENTSPVILRTYSNFSCTGDDEERESYALCQLYQWGKLCTEASLNAYIFMSKEGYATHRIRSGRVTERIKRQFDTKIDLLKKHSVNS